jgi:hypothetical protein
MSLDITHKTIYQDKAHGIVVEGPNDRRGVYTFVFLSEAAGPMRVPVTFRQAASIKEALVQHMDNESVVEIAT